MITPKQEKFSNIYVETGNASEAYRGAYNCKTAKPESINVSACKLLADPKIKQRVKELQRKLAIRSDIDKDEAVEILTNICRVNPLDYVSIEAEQEIEPKDTGDTIMSLSQKVVVKDLTQLSKEQQKCIKSITPTKFGLKIEFESKINAIDRLSKMLGWDSPVQVQTSSVNVEVLEKYSETKSEIEKLR